MSEEQLKQQRDRKTDLSEGATRGLDCEKEEFR